MNYGDKLAQLTVKQALFSGIQAHKSGQFQEADRYYTAILQIEPRHPDANHNMGVLAVDLGKFQEALPFFKTALDVNPNIDQFWFSYMDVLIRLGRLKDTQTLLEQAKANGISVETISRLTEKIAAKELDEDHSLQNLYNEAISLKDAGDFAAAIPLLQKCIVGNSEEPRLLAMLSHCFLQLDEIDKAQDLIERAKKIKPLHDSVGWTEARILLRKKSFSEALLVAQTTLEKFSNSPEGLGVLGACLRAVDQLDQSLEILNKAIVLNPNYAEALINRGLIALSRDQKSEALRDLEKAFEIKPHITQIWNYLINLSLELSHYSHVQEILEKMVSFSPNDEKLYVKLGFCYHQCGSHELAIEAYRKAISINSEFAEAYNNIGVVLKETGDTTGALEAFWKGIEVKPDYAEVFNNIGILYKDKGKFREAFDAYNQAVTIKPDYADAYYNLGTALQFNGQLDEAIKAYEKVLLIVPDYAEAYNSMGIVLQDKGEIKESSATFEQALSIRPKYADVYYNLVGTAERVIEAKEYLEECLQIQPGHVPAEILLSALNFYEGDSEKFQELSRSTIAKHPSIRSLRWVFSLPELPEIYFHRWAFFDGMIALCENDRPFYEFGVWRGVSFKYLIKKIKKGYGFDTFEGLPEDWHSESAGSYSSEGSIPEVEGGEFIIGPFEQSLPEFFRRARPVAALINFDADMYSSTICALNSAKSVIDAKTILIFDEFLMNDFWEEDEYKALEEFCSTNGFAYEVIAVSFFTKQVAVRIVGL